MWKIALYQHFLTKDIITYGYHFFAWMSAKTPHSFRSMILSSQSCSIALFTLLVCRTSTRASVKKIKKIKKIHVLLSRVCETLTTPGPLPSSSLSFCWQTQHAWLAITKKAVYKHRHVQRDKLDFHAMLFLRAHTLYHLDEETQSNMEIKKVLLSNLFGSPTNQSVLLSIKLVSWISGRSSHGFVGHLFSHQEQIPIPLSQTTD